MAGRPTTSRLSDFARDISLLVTSTVELAQNIDFLNLRAEMVW